MARMSIKSLSCLLILPLVASSDPAQTLQPLIELLDMHGYSITLDDLEQFKKGGPEKEPVPEEESESESEGESWLLAPFRPALSILIGVVRLPILIVNNIYSAIVSIISNGFWVAVLGVWKTLQGFKWLTTMLISMCAMILYDIAKRALKKTQETDTYVAITLIGGTLIGMFDTALSTFVAIFLDAPLRLLIVPLLGLRKGKDELYTLEMFEASKQPVAEWVEDMRNKNHKAHLTVESIHIGPNGIKTEGIVENLEPLDTAATVSDFDKKIQLSQSEGSQLLNTIFPVKLRFKASLAQFAKEHQEKQLAWFRMQAESEMTRIQQEASLHIVEDKSYNSAVCRKRKLSRDASAILPGRRRISRKTAQQHHAPAESIGTGGG